MADELTLLFAYEMTCFNSIILCSLSQHCVLYTYSKLILYIIILNFGVITCKINKATVIHRYSIIASKSTAVHRTFGVVATILWRFDPCSLLT